MRLNLTLEISWNIRKNSVACFYLIVFFDFFIALHANFFLFITNVKNLSNKIKVSF